MNHKMKFYEVVKKFQTKTTFPKVDTQLFLTLKLSTFWVNRILGNELHLGNTSFKVFDFFSLICFQYIIFLLPFHDMDSCVLHKNCFCLFYFSIFLISITNIYIINCGSVGSFILSA